MAHDDWDKAVPSRSAGKSRPAGPGSEGQRPRASPAARPHALRRPGGRVIPPGLCSPFSRTHWTGLGRPLSSTPPRSPRQPNAQESLNDPTSASGALKPEAPAKSRDVWNSSRFCFCFLFFPSVTPLVVELWHGPRDALQGRACCHSADSLPADRRVKDVIYKIPRTRSAGCSGTERLRTGLGGKAACPWRPRSGSSCDCSAWAMATRYCAGLLSKAPAARCLCVSAETHPHLMLSLFWCV